MAPKPASSIVETLGSGTGMIPSIGSASMADTSAAGGGGASILARRAGSVSEKASAAGDIVAGDTGAGTAQDRDGSVATTPAKLSTSFGELRQSKPAVLPEGALLSKAVANTVPVDSVNAAATTRPEVFMVDPAEQSCSGGSRGCPTQPQNGDSYRQAMFQGLPPVDRGTRLAMRGLGGSKMDRSTHSSTWSFTWWALIVAAAVLALPAAMAQSRVSAADSVFLIQAAQNGQAEVQVGRLALEKTQNSDVKTFAQRMVDEHSAWAAELGTLAAAKGVKLPEEASAAQKGDINQLATADSYHFDQRYAAAMGVHAHEETIALFQRAASSADDPEVRGFAAKTLPMLQFHLQMARGLKAATDARRPPGS